MAEVNYRIAFQLWLESQQVQQCCVQTWSKIIFLLHKAQTQQGLSGVLKIDNENTEEALACLRQASGQEKIAAWKHYSDDELRNAINKFYMFLKAKNRLEPWEKREAMRAEEKKRKDWERLKERIQIQFEKKDFLADILVTDDQFRMLVDETVNLIRMRADLNDGGTVSPILAVTLVQIAARYYDGRFWPHVWKSLEISGNQSITDYLSKSFVQTLVAYKKTVVNKSQYVQSIVFHAFVSDYYAKGLFELLFAYYEKDLERDLSQNTKEQMDSLILTLSDKSKLSDEQLEKAFTFENGKKSQAYKLRQHTLQAIEAFPGYAKRRFRCWLRAIDTYFWRDQALARVPSSRMMRLFKEWAIESDTLNRSYNERKSGIIRQHGKKHFSSPYFHVDYDDTRFSICMPSQFVPASVSSAKWVLESGSGLRYEIPCNLYTVVTGLKTEKDRVDIPAESITDKWTGKLVVDGENARIPFSIEESDFRFFDMDGDVISSLEKGQITAYGKKECALSSPALLDSVLIGSMARFDFDFEEGDVVIFPNKIGRIVGSHYVDGLSPHGKVKNAVCKDAQNNEIPLYNALPGIVLAIDKTTAERSRFYINQRLYTFDDLKPVEFERFDARGKTALLLQPECEAFQAAIKQGDVNEVIVDLPGAAFAKKYRFAFYPGLETNFAEKPYLKQTEGILVLQNACELIPEPECEDGAIEEIKMLGNGEFGFSVKCYPDWIPFIDSQSKLTVSFAVPAIQWSLDEKEWTYGIMKEIWYTELPTMLYIKAPAEKIQLRLEAEIVSDDEVADGDDTSIVVKKGMDTGYFTIDLTRMKSWISREKAGFPLFLGFNHSEYQFGCIVTKSIALEGDCTLEIDPSKDQVDIGWPVLGGAKYCMDVVSQRSGEYILEKTEYDGEKIALPATIQNGNYLITIYECVEDEYGFGDVEYQTVASTIRTVFNPEDLSGMKLELNYIERKSQIVERVFFKGAYYVEKLTKVAPNEYTGLLVYTRDEHADKINVKVCFDDCIHPEKGFELLCRDEEYGDYLDFLFDRNKQTLEKDVDETLCLTRAEEYLRYKSIDDRFFFVGTALED